MKMGDGSACHGGNSGFVSIYAPIAQHKVADLLNGFLMRQTTPFCFQGNYEFLHFFEVVSIKCKVFKRFKSHFLWFIAMRLHYQTLTASIKSCNCTTREDPNERDSNLENVLIISSVSRSFRQVLKKSGEIINEANLEKFTAKMICGAYQIR